MKILITGASGFIGSFIAEEGLARGMEVWAGVRSSSSKKYLRDERLHFIDLCFADREKLRSQISEHTAKYGKWDYIVHNAGITKCLNPTDFDKVNFLNTENFVEALQAAGATPSKFVFMSSLSARPEPDTAYGISKRKAEMFLESQTNFPYIILRPTGVYGPRDKDYFLMFKTVNSGWNFTAGFQPQRLTFIYVKDLVKAVYLALESDVRQKIYCIADGDVYSDAEYTEIIMRALGKKRVIRIRVPLFLLKTVCTAAEFFGKLSGIPATLNRDKYRIMRQRDWTCDTQLIRDDLNFRADYSLERGIFECTTWYRDNKWL
jgi:nucleoside-diphosphate-sugar epimerase